MPFEPGRGIRAARERSAALDEIVAPLVGRLPDASSPVAVLALGSYGRRELTPGSDIDLLVLHRGRLTSREATEAIFYPLWDRKLDLGHAVRSLDEARTIGRNDRDTATSFLDARFIAGDQALFADFEKRVIQAIRKDRSRLIRWLRAEREGRYQDHVAVADGHSPEIKEGRGGLRDLNAARWLDQHLESDDRLGAALDLLLQARAAVQAIVGRAPEQLRLEIQPAVAEELGFGSGVAGGDALMRAIYQSARWVAFSMDRALSDGNGTRHLGNGLVMRNGQLFGLSLPPVETVPEVALRVANFTRLAPSSDELLIWASVPGPEIAWTPAALEEFVALLRHADARSWSFLDVTGLLVRLIPEWRAIHLRRQHNAFHVLATDAHCLATVRHIHEWAEKGGEPIGRHVWKAVRNRDWLYFAALVHDIGKSDGNGDHSGDGRMIAGLICERIGLSPVGRETVMFLVENHLLLAETATRRDLNDEDLIFDLAGKIESHQRLEMLYLLTIADGRATGPGAWGAWKAELVRDLFVRLANALGQSADVGRRARRSIEHHRLQLTEELTRRNRTDMIPMVARLPRRFLLGRSATSLMRHLVLARDQLAEGELRTAIHKVAHTDTWEMLIATRDRRGLLATVAGVLALHGANVLGAEAATCSDGLVLDAFTIGSAFDVPLDPSIWPDINADIRAALNGELKLSERLSRRSARYDRALVDMPTRVTVDNTTSQFYSVIEVRAPDRVGLLYRIAQALSDLEIDIHHARIATHPVGVIDVFYVWDLSGQKLEDDTATHVADALTDRLRAGTDPA